MREVTILDQRGGVLKTIHTDSHSNSMFEVTTEDLDPLIRQADRMRHARGTKTQDFEEGMVVAGYIPIHVAERMMREGSFNDEAALKRWLNDPQNECFRVWKGTV